MNNNYSKEIGNTYYTDGGKYTIVSNITTGWDGHDVNSGIEVYIGRHTDGHNDLLVSDNASIWVVGSEDDAERNWAAWSEIETKCGILPWGKISEIDADLADWLKDRRRDAVNAMHVGDDKIVNTREADIGRAIADRWYDIPSDVIIRRGLDPDNWDEEYHFASTSRDLPGTASWDMGDDDDVDYPDYYAAPWNEDEGDSADCGNWEYYLDSGAWYDKDANRYLEQPIV